MINKAIIGAAFLTALSSASYAADVKCACLAKTDSSITVSEVKGAVTLTNAKGYSVAKAGSALSDGATLMTGKEGFARVAAGNCAVELVSKMSVSVSAQDGQMCVSTAKVFGTGDQVYGADVDPALIPAEGSAGAGSGSVAPLIGFGLVGSAIAASVITANKDDDNPVSP